MTKTVLSRGMMTFPRLRGYCRECGKRTHGKNSLCHRCRFADAKTRILMLRNMRNYNARQAAKAGLAGWFGEAIRWR